MKLRKEDKRSREVLLGKTEEIQAVLIRKKTRTLHTYICMEDPGRFGAKHKFKRWNSPSCIPKTWQIVFCESAKL